MKRGSTKKRSGKMKGRKSMHSKKGMHWVKGHTKIDGYGNQVTVDGHWSKNPKSHSRKTKKRRY